MTDIQASAARFNAAQAAHEAAIKKLRDLDIDIAVAERNGEPVEPIQKARNLALMSEWSPTYNSRKSAALALCDALSVDAKALRSALA